mgnify:CR=1 FL=1
MSMKMEMGTYIYVCVCNNMKYLLWLPILSRNFGNDYMASFCSIVINTGRFCSLYQDIMQVDFSSINP